MRYRVGNRDPVGDHAERVIGNASGAQKRQLPAVRLDDGGFQPDFALSAVQNHVHSAVHIVRNIGGTGGGWLSGEVCGGCRNGESAQRNQAVCHRV